MKLYDFIKMTEADYDTYDVVYDNGVTVCFFDEEDDYEEEVEEAVEKAVEETLDDVVDDTVE